MEEEAYISFSDYHYSNQILSYILCFINPFIIMVSLFITKAKNKNIKKLQLKLYALLIIDTNSEFFYANYVNYFNLLIPKIIFSFLSTIEFYILISIIYQIFNTSESPKKQKIELVNSIQLSFLFFLVDFFYYKYSYSNQQIIIIIIYIIIFCCIQIFYRYMRNKINEIANKLKERNTQSKKIYYYLKILNTANVIFFTIYNIFKLISEFVNNQIKIFILIGISPINYGLKYFIIIFLVIIIYTVNKFKFKHKYFSEERIGIASEN